MPAPRQPAGTIDLLAGGGRCSIGPPDLSRGPGPGRGRSTVLCRGRWASSDLGGLAALRGDHAQARRHHETARQLAPTTGVRDSVAIADNAFGFAARLRDDATTAKASHEHALSVLTDLRSPTGIAHSLCCLGYAEIQLRRTVQARVTAIGIAVSGLRRTQAHPIT